MDDFLSLENLQIMSDQNPINEEAFPILEGITPTHLRVLNMEGKAFKVNKGVKILQDGQVPDSLYFIIAGRFDIIKNNHPIASLIAGDLFGEYSLLRASTCYATVVAHEDSQFIQVHHDTMLQLIQAHHPLEQRLKKLMEQRLLESFLSSHPIFDPLTLSMQTSLMADLSIKKVNAGDALFKNGQEIKHIHIIIHGEIDVFTEEKGSEAKLKDIRRQNDFIGLYAFVSAQAYQGNAYAKVHTDLALFPKRALLRLSRLSADVHQHLKMAVRHEAARESS